MSSSIERRLSRTAGGGETGGVRNRLHHLDWLRSTTILVVVMGHAWQILDWVPKVLVDNRTYEPWHSGAAPNPLWARYASVTRQWCLPLLFFVSGASLALGRLRLAATIKKLAAITGVGMSANAVLLLVGPMDDHCSFRESLPKLDINGTHVPNPCHGPLLNFVVAPFAGLAFPVIFQFWYTIYFMISLPIEFPLLSLLQAVVAGGVSPYILGTRLSLHLMLVAALDLAYYSISNMALQSLLLVLLLEPFVAGALLLSASAQSPRHCRVWQYVAAGLVVLQFGAPDFAVDSLNGGVMLYYQFFKQLLSLGFTVMTTRHKVGAVASTLWPLWFVTLCTVAPSTNFALEGMITYPYYQRWSDRVSYMAGAAVIIFILDRMGHVCIDLLEPCPDWIQRGALLCYLFHPIGIVLSIAAGIQSPAINALFTYLSFCAIAAVRWQRAASTYEDLDSDSSSEA